MQLFKVPPPPMDLVVKPEDQALAQRETLLDVAENIKAIATADDNELAAECGSGIQKMLKGVESARKELTAPYLAAQRTIKATADTFCEPLTKALDRLGRLAVGYRQEQERKAEAERQARAQEIARLQEEARKSAEEAKKAAASGDLMAGVIADLTAQALNTLTASAIAVPQPEATKTAGQVFRPNEFDYEVTDINALYAARPDLCNPPTDKRAAIKACLTVNSKVPGLRLFPKPSVSFKSR
jgi:hypothetical protein